MEKTNRSSVQSRIPRPELVKLAELAKKLHTKPGPLGSWMLEIYADPKKPDLNSAGLHSLNLAAKYLGQLAQRLTAFDQFVMREWEIAGPDASQKHNALRKHQELTKLLETIYAEADLCQGIAASLVCGLPEEVLPDFETAKKILASGPSAVDSELQKMMAYLIALHILPDMPQTT